VTGARTRDQRITNPSLCAFVTNDRCRLNIETLCLAAVMTLIALTGAGEIWTHCGIYCGIQGEESVPSGFRRTGQSGNRGARQSWSRRVVAGIVGHRTVR
jgi:hypothetical protein